MSTMADPVNARSPGEIPGGGDGEQFELEIPEGTEALGQKAFCGCRGLTSITLPDTLTENGAEAISIPRLERRPSVDARI